MKVNSSFQDLLERSKRLRGLCPEAVKDETGPTANSKPSSYNDYTLSGTSTLAEGSGHLADASALKMYPPC